MKLLRYLIFAAGPMLAACDTQPGYPPEFEPFIDSFVDEAGKRGRDLSGIREQVIIQYEDLSGVNGGKCTRSFFFPNRISINKFFWQQMNDRQKEMLLFHELGHCVLDRDHRNEKFSQGECVSLMDGTEDDFFCSNNFYSEHWRAYYLDELFNEKTQAPEWYVVRDFAVIEVTDTLLSVTDTLLITNNDRKWYFVSSVFEWDSVSSYLIELTYFSNQRDTSALSEEYGQHFMAKFGEYEMAVLAGNGHSVGFSSGIGTHKDYYYRSPEKSEPQFPLKFSLLKKDGWLTFFINGEQKHLFEENHYRVDPEVSLRQRGRIHSIIAPVPNAHLIVYEVKH